MSQCCNHRDHRLWRMQEHGLMLASPHWCKCIMDATHPVPLRTLYNDSHACRRWPRFNMSNAALHSYLAPSLAPQGEQRQGPEGWVRCRRDKAAAEVAFQECTVHTCKLTGSNPSMLRSKQLRHLSEHAAIDKHNKSSPNECWQQRSQRAAEDPLVGVAQAAAAAAAASASASALPGVQCARAPALVSVKFDWSYSQPRCYEALLAHRAAAGGCRGPVRKHT
jgi:hypothetical protein